MSTVTEIRDAIRKLPPQEAWRLAEELREHLEQSGTNSLNKT
jgi:hypothetical protein